ncbi:MAG: hypothetical protein Ta2E_11550 [Mycoplasmoidaceae bacterium]|nr:MAG: hypothetical protein Ta2E_11550 [Mycoplasmoidaceae bacterium]
MLYVGKIGSKKTREVLKHLLICDNVGENNTWFYSQIVYACSVGEDDKTYSTFKKALKNPLIKVSPKNWGNYLINISELKKLLCDLQIINEWFYKS